MPGNPYFRFRQFTVFQHQAAMKVCTDACLFGAWADIQNAERIFDIGTGTGLLSLMAAQRNQQATITGVEIDEPSFSETQLNFGSSIFADRLSVFHSPIQEFSAKLPFDSIICNPPFYQDSLRSPDHRTGTAMHAVSLDFTGLLEASARLLAPGGKLNVLLSVAESFQFERLARLSGWRLTRELTLSHRPDGTVFRRMMTFVREEEFAGLQPEKEHISIYSQEPGIYSDGFRNYLKPFYLGL